MEAAERVTTKPDEMLPNHLYVHTLPQYLILTVILNIQTLLVYTLCHLLMLLNVEHSSGLLFPKHILIHYFP